MRRSKTVAVVLAVVVIVGIIAGLWIYYQNESPTPSESFTISSPPQGMELSPNSSACHSSTCPVTSQNVTLLILISNNGTQSITSTAVWVNNSPLGSCDVSISPSTSYPCTVEGSVPCSVIQGANSYSMKAVATYENGGKSTYLWNESPQFLGATCPS